MNEVFGTIKDIISNRRTTKPQQMNGKKIADNDISSILALADFAPTHGNTEPWRFMVYSNQSVTDFCHKHAGLYRNHTSLEKYETGKYEKIKTMGDRASHIIIAVMQRGNLPKIPVWEEAAATACAVQNMLLGATALGIASYWGSGGMVGHHALKDYLELNESDFIMAILYFGYTDIAAKMMRMIPMEEKVKWM